MSIGNEILPNVYIDNIELSDYKINFSVFVLDSIDNPKWSNEKKFIDLMEIKIHVSQDPNIISEISSGIRGFNKLDENVESFLLFDLSSSDSIGNFIGFLSIFASVCVPELNIEGPIASEKIIENNKLLTTTNVLFKNGKQYYGPAHLHDGDYMEGMVHSNRSHSFLTLRSVPNLKLKDLRKKEYEIKKAHNL